MQQTEKYKLDLIETSDPFSPDALNANAQKLEDAAIALDGRVLSLEGRRMVFGIYYGYGKSNVWLNIDLGEQPFALLVLTIYQYGTGSALLVKDGRCFGSAGDCLVLWDTGFSVRNDLNKAGNRYNFIAFFGDWPLIEVPNLNDSE